MVQSSLLSSNVRKPRSRSPVILTITGRYCSATESMSNVEFQRVDTSRGMSRGVSLSLSQVRRHSGRREVGELTILKESLRICGVRQPLSHTAAVPHGNRLSPAPPRTRASNCAVHDRSRLVAHSLQPDSTVARTHRPAPCNRSWLVLYSPVRSSRAPIDQRRQ